ncbi:MAG: APA family fibronectin-binding glycoprotein, partial [Mycobacterium sp.]
MDQVNRNSARPKSRWTTLAIATVSSAGAITFALPATTAGADPVPPPPPTPPTAAAPVPAPP